MISSQYSTRVTFLQVGIRKKKDKEMKQVSIYYLKWEKEKTNSATLMDLPIIKHRKLTYDGKIRMS